MPVTFLVSSPVVGVCGLVHIVVAPLTLVYLGGLHDLQVSVGLQMAFVVALARGGIVALLANVEPDI